MNHTSSRPLESATKSPSKSYFGSPLRTLSESLEDPERTYISCHDIAEAYNTLSLRIQRQRDALSGTQPPSCISAFLLHSARLEQCIAREIRCCLPDPFASQSAQQTTSIPLSYDTSSTQDDDDCDERIPLCCWALRLISTIFMYPSLYSIFSSGQRSGFLQLVVSLCDYRTLDLRGGRILWQHALRTLDGMHFPPETLLAEAGSIYRVLELPIKDTVDESSGKLEVFRVIASLLGRLPVLVDPLIGLLPHILSHLTDNDLSCRIYSAFALSGFAEAKLKSIESSTFPHQQLILSIKRYLREQCSELNADKSQSLPVVLHSGLLGDQSWQSIGDSFAISVTAMLVFLLDSSLFSAPEVINSLAKNVLHVVAGRDWKGVGAHTELCKIIQWCFSRMPIKTGSESQTDAAVFKLLRARNLVFQGLKQDLDNGVGTVLVRTLLSVNGAHPMKGDLDKVVEVVGEMAQSDKVGTRKDGVAILHKLTSTIGASTTAVAQAEQTSDQVMFSRCLVDGRLIGVKSKELKLSRTSTDVTHIRPLEQEEVTAHWKEFLDICCFIVQRHLEANEGELPADIVQIWQALLLVPTDLSESHHHITASNSVAAHITKVVNNLVVPSEMALAQATYLTTILQLWRTMKNTFTRKWLSSPAERILAAILKNKFDLENQQVKTLWSQLCAELVAVGVPSLLHVLHTRSLSPSQEGREVTRTLWYLLSSWTTGASDGEDASLVETDWVDLVHLMVMPLGTWNLEKQELEMWETLLKCAVQMAKSCGRPDYDVASFFLELTVEAKMSCLIRLPRAFSNLLPHLIGCPMTQDVLRFLPWLDTMLLSAYPNGSTDTAGIIRFAESAISSATKENIVDVLSCLRKSLRVWIADEEHALTDEGYDALVNALYVEALATLSQVDPNLDHLYSLAEYLHSPFVRPHREGVLAFQAFWRSAYHPCKTIIPAEYPLSIKACLKAWSDVCNDSLADGLSLASGSQSLESFSVPDSQLSSSPYKGQYSDGLDISIFAYPSFDYNTHVDDLLEEDSEIDDSTPTARKHQTTPKGNTRKPKMQRKSQTGCSLDIEPQGLLDWPKTFPSKYGSPRTPQRRQTAPDVLKQINVVDGDRRRHPSNRHSNVQPSLSEPLTGASSPLLPPSSQPYQSKKRRRDQSPAWVGPEIKRPRRESEPQIDVPIRKPHPPSSDDYDSWERGILTGDQADEQDGQNPLADSPDDDLSPSAGDHHRSRRRERSQTAPEPSTAPESESVHIPQVSKPLRRNRSSPLHQRGASVPVEVLEDAYAAWCGAGPSQIEVEDLLRARRITNQIHQMLDEQMARKFNSRAE